MAGSDPKTNRALGQTSNRADIDAEEDPLIELARIVSEDGGFSGPKPEKPKMTRSEPVERDAFADGLEAELLQELETSFAVRATPAPVSAAPAARGNPQPATVRVAAPSPAAVVRPQPAEQESDPDDLLRSIEEQLSQFERRQAGRFAATSGFPEPAADETSISAATAEEPAGTPFGAPDRAAEPREDWQSRRTSRIRPFAESVETLEEALEVAPEPAPEELPASPAPRTEYRFRGPASANWDRAEAAQEELPRTNGNDHRHREEQLRFDDDRPEAATFAPVEPLPPESLNAREPADNGGRGDAQGTPDARRERLMATFPEFDEPAPPPRRPAPDLAGIEAELSRELEPNYATSLGREKWEDGDAPADEPRVAAAIAPGPSRRAAAARAAAAQRGRSRVGLLAALIIIVLVIGGAGAFYLRSSESTPSGPPPVIAAEPGAVRVDATAEQNASGGETVGEAVYNRVAGTAPPTDEQVVENTEEPREIARIVLPQSQSNSDDTVVRPVGGSDASAAPDAQQPAPATASGEPADGQEEIGPRRVPTFVVKADGSIVATSEAGAATPDPTAAQDLQLANETQPIQPVPVPTVAIAEAGSTNDAGTASPPVRTPPDASAAPATAADAMQTRPTIDEPPAEVTAAPAASPTTTVASAEAAPTPPSPGASGGFLVQLSAQRSMEQAQSNYAKARQSFPSVLGQLEPNIQQADLGAKGIYFRVRVGPWATRDEAVGVCESLKAAGGSCFVTQ